MSAVVAVLATLDTKGDEAGYLREQIESQGCRAVLIDMGVLGAAGCPPDVDRAAVAEAGGTPLEQLLQAPSRQAAGPVMVRGATRVLQELLAKGEVQAVIGMGGTQGTSSCTAVMRELPYGFPKLMLSTVASGDTSAFVGIKDISMMFSVADILGLNPFLRKILSNAAAAACGMARSQVVLETRRDTGKPVVAMTNLGTLTEGATRALERFERAGYEVVVFHAIGAGGLAMEQMMRDGLIGAVFDYALGEITDELLGGLRAAGPERLTVAGSLGLPQVICPGGVEHVGLLVEADTVPPEYRGRKRVFHSPIVLAPRLDSKELRRVAQAIGERLAHSRDRTYVFVPRGGTSRYAIEGGPLHDPVADRAFFDELKTALPSSVKLCVRDSHAEEPAFVDEAVDTLIALIEGRTPAAAS